LPAYRVIEQSGPSHLPHFTIQVSVGDAAATGAAGSKRAAEQAAASALLALLPP
jgi:ribonuclease-3